ncbi:unnamed protein product [Penicillium viridicatum]
MTDNPFLPPQHHPVVVCSQYKIGVRPKETNAHLNNQHKKLSPAVRQRIATSLAIPIASITKYPDGLIYTVQHTDRNTAKNTSPANIYQYIARTPQTIKKH